MRMNGLGATIEIEKEVISQEIRAAGLIGDEDGVLHITRTPRRLCWALPRLP